MKPIYKIVVPAVLLLLLAVGWGIGYTLRNAPTVQGEQLPEAISPQKLAPLGLQFTPISTTDPQAQGSISQQQAIAAALQETPGLKSATKTSAVFGTLSNAGLRDAKNKGVSVPSSSVDMSAVWIVTFYGIETSSSGPPGASHYVSQQYNVVINAKTGKYIMAFPT